jgi:hypothetical protein
MAATRDARARFRVFWTKLAVQYYRDYHSHARRRVKDLIDFITKRVQDAIEKSEFKRMGEKFSRISITRAIAQIGREDENEAAAPAAGID